MSKLVQKARHEGPQIVALRGERTAVVLSAHDYDALRAGRPTLVDGLLGGPAWDVGVSRSASNTRCMPAFNVSNRRKYGFLF
ncbi:hypothetical protein N184_31590 [Sinorhizobium sp. GL28]|nr:hypothetical protein N184_31590 [Sinorhizobium sp. GL28]